LLAVSIMALVLAARFCVAAAVVLGSTYTYYTGVRQAYNIISLDRPSILLCLLMYVGYNIAYRVGIILRLFSVDGELFD